MTVPIGEGGRPGSIRGHGIDLVEERRIAAMLADHGERFLERVFTERERAYAESSQALRAERFAARFAAKEAVLKALGTGWSGGIAWQEVEVTRGAGGAPGIQLHGRAAEVAKSLGIGRWHLSLSHAAGFSIASAIAEGLPPRDPLP
jgi:holo-[acyl-carrier protein] synthase